MEIKELSPTTFDIFLGKGWENWVRARLENKGRKVTIISQADHVDVTPKLAELIFFKIKKFINKAKNG